ncbi:RNA polymerase sigma factor [Nocardioides sp. LHG3406-4]|uniref:RNA polymerase sigma factor n=1 Tax=Nocardioides sp. LHG3406-4 TaxID=2804575 RepID=UPI003CE88DDB
MSAGLEDVWRREVPHVLGALVRRYGDFDACEDALQEAMADATVQWARDGVPEQPRGWLVRVASRRLVDRWRGERARADRELRVAAEEVDPGPGPAEDDTLDLLFLCCHPSLSTASQVALALRAVGGLSTEQVAAGFLVPTTTMGQRISRAKGTLREAGARFGPLPAAERPARLAAVRHVLYLVFNEGYTVSRGEALVDVSLTDEAIRLCRLLHERLPGDDETAGLLALMVLTAARTPARTDHAGDLVRLADQDRSLWDRRLVAEGVAILERVLPRGRVGRFQLEAAVAAVHAEAARVEDTDWPQIATLYAMLHDVSPSPAVTLSRAVAVGMAEGPLAGLALTDPLLADRSMSRHHRLHSVRGHLLELAGRPGEAAEAYRVAASLSTSIPEQRYLNARAAEVRRQARPS